MLICVHLQGESPHERGRRPRQPEFVQEGASADRRESDTAITKDMPTDTAFRLIVTACRAELAKHRETLLSTDDVEGVHQTRVALRRLRAAFALFRNLAADPELPTIDAQARHFARECGPARDLHVFLSETAPDAPESVTRIGRKLAGDRLLQARRALSGEDFDAFDRSLERLASRRPSSVRETVGEFGRRKLDDCLRRGHGASKLTAKELHRLRIAAKRLRYAATFLAPAFAPEAAPEYIKATETLQDALGAFNDRTVGKRVLTDIKAAAGSKRAQAPCKRLEKRLAKTTPERRRCIKNAWKSFKKANPLWHENEQ